MDWLKKYACKKLDEMRAIVVDDDQRRELIFIWFNLLLSLVSGFMTIVNVFTAKWLLLCSTFLFCIACLINVRLMKKHCRFPVQDLFMLEGTALCIFFCISGTPEGFSALWTCFIPSFSMTLVGRKRGSFYSIIVFFMVAFIFFTPFGRSLLHYNYTDSFMLRFPMIYFAFYIMALFLETIRAETQSQLRHAERLYQHLYNHDALTGIYNRYGFNEKLEAAFADNNAKPLSLLVLDLDHFKNINDTYGHDKGDAVLKFTALTLLKLTGETVSVCRWGGEEFTVLLQNGEDALGLAETIRKEIESSVIECDGVTMHITVSIGVCVVPDRKKTTIARLVKEADQCLYNAKESGRNQVKLVRL